MAKAAPPTLRMEAGKSRPQVRTPDLVPSHKRRAIAAALVSYAIIVLLLSTGNFLHPFKTGVGSILTVDVVAPFEVTAVDPRANLERRREIEQRGQLIWEMDRERASMARQKLNALIDLIARSNPQTAADLNKLVAEAPAQTGIAIDAPTVGNLLPARLQSLSPPITIEFLRTQLGLILDDVLAARHVVANRNLYEGNLSSNRLVLRDLEGKPLTDRPDPKNVLVWRDEVENYLQLQGLPRYFPNAGHQAMRDAALAVLMQLIGGPDIVFSQRQTDDFKALQLSQLEAKPIVKTYAEGDVVAKAGEPVSPVQSAALEQLNTRRRSVILTKMLGIMLITAIIFAAVTLYVLRYREGFRIDASSVLLHALPVIFGLAAGQAALFALPDQSLVKYCFPAAMVALLTSLAVNPRTGFVMVMVGASLFGIVNGQGLDFMMLALMSGFTAVLSSRRLRERGDLIQVAWSVGLVNVLVVAIFTFIAGNRTPNLIHMLVAFLNALISVGASLFLIRYFERYFGIVTDLRLLELTGLRHPLITQLEEKAPGSYQHVLNVTKLAEAAANAIGANYLLVRAGALFHDIGKMVKPKYFSENQVTIEDKRAHSRLSPYMSTLIIKNHVKEGVELARESGLPQKIIDFIPQHHGTGLIRFFYASALKRYEESATANPVREDDFRYPGPRPQTIEAAVVLLADSVEAIAASKFTGGQVNEDEIRRVTQMAISERFNDGQFDECDLTMRHLRDMREAFVRTLMARYHFRVAYPTLPKAPAPRSETTSTSIAIAGPVMRSENPN